MNKMAWIKGFLIALGGIYIAFTFLFSPLSFKTTAVTPLYQFEQNFNPSMIKVINTSKGNTYFFMNESESTGNASISFIHFGINQSISKVISFESFNFTCMWGGFDVVYDINQNLLHLFVCGIHYTTIKNHSINLYHLQIDIAFFQSFQVDFDSQFILSIKNVTDFNQTMPYSDRDSYEDAEKHEDAEKLLHQGLPFNPSGSLGSDGILRLVYQVVTYRSEHSNELRYTEYKNNSWDLYQVVGDKTNAFLFLDEMNTPTIYYNDNPYFWYYYPCESTVCITKGTTGWVEKSIYGTKLFNSYYPLIQPGFNNRLYLFYLIDGTIYSQYCLPNGDWSINFPIQSNLQTQTIDVFFSNDAFNFSYVENNCLYMISITLTIPSRSAAIRYCYHCIDEISDRFYNIGFFSIGSSVLIAGYGMKKAMQLRIPYFLRMVDESIEKIEKGKFQATGVMLSRDQVLINMVIDYLDEVEIKWEILDKIEGYREEG